MDLGPGTGNATRTVEMFDPATGEGSRMASAPGVRARLDPLDRETGLRRDLACWSAQNSRPAYAHPMCRSIQDLRRRETPATHDEIEAAALQFVRKVSGYRQPSRVNQAAFERAVAEVAGATTKLLDDLTTARAS
jgi:hypothetical protein